MVAALVATALLLAVGPWPVSGQAPSEPVASPVASAAPVVELPAGMQFGTTVTGPAALRQRSPFESGAVRLGDRILGFSARPGKGGLSGTISQPVAAILSPDGTWTVETIETLRGVRPPAGTYATQFGATVSGAAVDDDGIVAIGNAKYSNPSGGAVTQVPFVWTSADGRSWRRTDPRPALGGRSAMLTDVVALPGGRLLAAGSVAPAPGKGPTRAVVITSSDGRRWERAATLDARWSLSPRAIVPVGDTLVLAAREYVCTADDGHLSTFSLGEQLRLWRSTDAGSSWTPVPLDDVAALGEARPGPRSPKDCPRDLAGKSALARDVAFLGALDGRLVLVGQDGVTVSTTTDLKTWANATLPLPDDLDADRLATSPGSRALVKDDTGSPALLWLGPWSQSSGIPVTGVGQVRGWTTNDGGASWVPLPAGPPMDLPLGGDLVVVSPQEVWLAVGQPQTAKRRGTVAPSVPGPASAWDACDPGPGADCRFATLSDLDLSGDDLSGIDLTHATIRDTDLTGASLRDARLDGALVDDSVLLSGADLSGASLRDAQVRGDLSEVTLTGADLRGLSAILPVTLAATLDAANIRDLRWAVPAELEEGLSLVGRDLAGASFYRDFTGDGLGDLRDVDVTRANLDGASFYMVDLTGTDLRTARWKELTFLGEIICPDGKPADATKSDAAACRLKPPRR